ncbi:MAG: hypothetical protein LUQ37_09595 [Methanoregulaceae archaeon]|jgi:hypothetical protein|nr:hypothetical protein [Methanoregulaceae archaeon]
MPEWLHNRAHHIMAKNPDMNKSTAFAIATQQSHALGKSPKGFGTPEGRSEAKAKFDTPKGDVKAADPGGLGKKQEKREDKGLDIRKEASTGVRSPFDLTLIDGFFDEMLKIANSMVIPQAPTEQLAHVKMTNPPSMASQGPMAAKNPGKYSKVNATPTESPSTRMQPVTAPPPVLR